MTADKFQCCCYTTQGSDSKTAASVYGIESYYHKALIDIATISKQNYKIITDRM
jgi:hypothetical protein